MLHRPTGDRNVQANYTMNGIQLAKVEQEKDLVISSDLKPSKQCSEVVKTDIKSIGFIGRSFEFRTEKIILNLYSALVRPPFGVLYSVLVSILQKGQGN